MEGKDFRRALLFDDVKKMKEQQITVTGAATRPTVLYNNVKKLGLKK
jgi:hypothetical protein